MVTQIFNSRLTNFFRLLYTTLGIVASLQVDTPLKAMALVAIGKRRS
jgi:hypothetical protein